MARSQQASSSAPPRPMLAIPAAGIPSGPEWVHEVKWDGMRILADVRDSALRLYSRNGNDVTARFPELAGLAETYDDLLLDGEVVALDGGRPSFHALTDRMQVRGRRRAQHLAAARPVTYMAFDLLRLFGSDVTARPWRDRRALLERLDLAGRHWQVPPVHDDGEDLYAATRENGLEGIVSKRRDSPYAAGRRAPDWRKSAHRTTLSAVVGGWRPEAGTTDRVGALLLGLPDGRGGWRYAGRAGSGLTGRVATRLRDEFASLASSSAPFSDTVPSEDADGATWLEPRPVVEIRTLGGPDQDRLRQPTFLGIRDDLQPEDLLDA